MDLKEEERQLVILIIHSTNMHASILIVSKSNNVLVSNVLSHYEKQSLLPTCYIEKTNIRGAEVKEKMTFADVPDVSSYK